MMPLVSRREFLQLGGAASMSLAFPGLARGARTGVPVFMYHEISFNFRDDYTIPPPLFAAHMECLYGNGYRSVSPRELSSLSSADRAFVLTFDDGFASFLEYVFPLLEEYGFVATINVLGSFAGTIGKGPMIAWDEYRHLVGSGRVQIGCHTYDLHNLSHRGAAGVPSEKLEADLRMFQQKVARETGSPVDILAWPFGLYTDASMRVARKAGFRYFLTSDEGKFIPGGDIERIPRMNMNHKHDLASFRKYIGETP